MSAPRQPFWEGPGGGREVLHIAYPLILSQISYTLQTFIDRVFLTWWSAEAVGGAVTGAISTLTLVGLFLGTGEYLTTFVAQYWGAGRHERIGTAMWQGIYFALAAGLAVALLSPLAGPFFALVGHAAAVRAAETTYAGILLKGAAGPILMATLASFFAGRGSTLTVLWVNIVATVVNVVFDYLWIFGHAGFPRWGVAGAAWATVLSQVVGAAVFFALIVRREHRRAFGTLSGWRFEPALFRRLLRFGLPAGLQLSLDVLAFSLFLFIVGRISAAALAASAVSFGLNTIVFFPMYGLGMGVSALVGRHLGAGRPELAERATWSGFRLSLVYMAACGSAYVLAPRLLLLPYRLGAEPVAFAALDSTAVVLLRFVALYSIFDMMNVIFAAGLKGAGDTRYPLALTVVLSWLVMLLPAWLLCEQLHFGLYTAWTAASAYVVLLGLLMLRRFRQGGWKALRVIEGPGKSLREVPDPEPA